MNLVKRQNLSHCRYLFRKLLQSVDLSHAMKTERYFSNYHFIDVNQ